MIDTSEIVSEWKYRRFGSTNVFRTDATHGQGLFGVNFKYRPGTSWKGGTTMTGV